MACEHKRFKVDTENQMSKLESWHF